MKIGLRVDIDTLNGAGTGLTRLLDVLSRHDIKASFFFSVGPDNMGRHLLRLFRRDFLMKMLRTRAPSLYGWDVLLRGTLWPGPSISRVLAPHLRRADADGHEIGLHAWDHHRWQTRIERFSPEEMAQELRRGIDEISGLLGKEPHSFAAPGWRATPELTRVEESLGFRYASDCRGSHPFIPVVDGKRLRVPQIPVTLPTCDERIGRDGITPRNYNAHLLSCIREDAINILAVHAEVEGMRERARFEAFLESAHASGMVFVPLGSFLPGNLDSLPSGVLLRGKVPGREGWVAVQGSP